MKIYFKRDALTILSDSQLFCFTHKITPLLKQNNGLTFKRATFKINLEPLSCHPKIVEKCPAPAPYPEAPLSCYQVQEDLAQH